jgi:hypothetical protein
MIANVVVAVVVILVVVIVVVSSGVCFLFLKEFFELDQGR